MSEDAGRRVVRLVLIGMLCMLFMISYVFWTHYEGRKELVQSQRHGCERAKLDRAANAKGWRSAQNARQRSGDISVSVRYGQLADDLEQRSQIDCAEVFPDAHLIP